MDRTAAPAMPEKIIARRRTATPALCWSAWTSAVPMADAVPGPLVGAGDMAGESRLTREVSTARAAGQLVRVSDSRAIATAPEPVGQYIGQLPRSARPVNPRLQARPSSSNATPVTSRICPIVVVVRIRTGSAPIPLPIMSPRIGSPANSPTVAR